MIHLQVLNLQGIVFEGGVRSITAPGFEGEFTVLPHHIPFLTSLKKGTITIRMPSEEKYVEVKEKGVFEMYQNRATILLS